MTSIAYLLLTDSDGWASLYGTDRHSHSKAADHMKHAEVCGEPLFEFAWLILDDGRVIPAQQASNRTPFDDNDYCQLSVRFSDPSIEDSYVVRWTIDGRT